MSQTTRNPDRSKSGSRHGQHRAGEHLRTASGHKSARDEPTSQRCTLDHVHDASCDFGRKAPPGRRSERRPEHESIKDPYTVGESHDLPSTSKDSDSDGWHRTTDRT